MQFLEDHAWPATLLTLFESIRNRPMSFPFRYHGSYLTLLYYCFREPDFMFLVAPQPIPKDGRIRDAVNYNICLGLPRNSNDLVCLVEVKDDHWNLSADLRYLADQQMRNRYSEMLEACPLPRLWGISLLGTKMRVYCGDTVTNTVDPPVSPLLEPLAGPTSDFLAGEWNLDILSQDGFQMMKEIVGDIYTHSQAT
ncbi:hypothetical protein AN958_00488 [Leucoagaricus sp. SymC.cos]|nr:hypothetical protein AN958_00488 [Leucoagaricus sp. SymC.cos]